MPYCCIHVYLIKWIQISYKIKDLRNNWFCSTVQAEIFAVVLILLLKIQPWNLTTFNYSKFKKFLMLFFYIMSKTELKACKIVSDAWSHKNICMWKFGWGSLKIFVGTWMCLPDLQLLTLSITIFIPIYYLPVYQFCLKKCQIFLKLNTPNLCKLGTFVM